MKTYDFKQVACIVGKDIITGFAEGDDAISVEFLQEDWQLTVGADGKATRAKTNNNAARVTLKLMKTSDANDLLNAYYQSDKASNSGVFPFMLKDNNGRELHVAEQMFIEKRPDPSFGQNVSEREWVLLTDVMVSNFGGNS